MKRGNEDKRSKTVLPISIYCVKLLTVDYYAVFIIIIIMDKIDRTFQDHQKCQIDKNTICPSRYRTIFIRNIFSYYSYFAGYLSVSER